MAVAKPIVVRRPGRNKGGWHAVETFSLRGVRTRCGVAMPMDKWIIGHDHGTTCRACVAVESRA